MERSLVYNRAIPFQSIISALFFFISSLFLFDVILGFNGRLLLIGDIPIRMVLYGAFFVILVVMIFYAVATKKSSAAGMLKLVKPIDIAVAAFLALNAIWVFIVPSLSGYGITMAIKQTIAFSVLLLYFPLILLIRLGYISWVKSHRLIKWNLLGLAALHIFLYIGEEISGNWKFALNFFDLFDTISMGHSVPPAVIYTEMNPKHFVRIIYPNSIFLLAMFYYFIIHKLNWKMAVFFLIGFTALLTTLTKSLWLGFAIGMVFILLFCLVNRRRFLSYWRPILACLTLVILTTLVLNSVLFHNYIFARVNSFFSVQEGSQRSFVNKKGIDVSQQNRGIRIADELDVTKRANLTRVTQTTKLLAKWKKSPWFGFGYGSYADHYLRSGTQTPYLYEMLLPSLLMNVGVLGLLVWAGFFLFVLYVLYRSYSNNRRNTVAIVYLLISLFVAAQFNPFLFGTSSMSIMLFCFIQMQHVSNERI
ncbi:O-antigen ligase [Paenibacillus sp. R14(2021)]|uniref:O-antigen ligase family protein n=1 Tax=Paenibacillus sp. R14(2021) TaxID=2859228 RepID=UPI001C616034|nr:O-antigen ligase family protein [Paenibacillus sp. R14(2021)]